MPDLSPLENILQVHFHDPCLLERALVHSSYVNENPASPTGSYERLEFLGDAVLGMIVAEKLYHDFPELAEGDLTKLRSALVRRDALTRMAADIHLGDFLYLGKGEEANGGRQKPINLAGALEAIIGAVFLDQGLNSAREITLRLISKDLAQLLREKADIDYKSQLQEIVQSQWHITPTYRLVDAVGPDHCRNFTVEVRVGDILLGTGAGRSKKSAEMEAARAALKQLAKSFTA